MGALGEFMDGFDGLEPGYLDYARVGPPGVRVRRELTEQLEIVGRARFGTLERLNAQAGRLAAAVAELTGFEPAQVAPQPNTGTGLQQAMFGLSGGILLSSGEFPSVTYAAARAAQTRGRLTPVWLETPDGRVTPERVRAQLSVDIDAVAVSLVDARTGHLADLSAIREVIGDRLLIVDAIQGFGVVDADYSAADVIAAGGHKWARGGWGTGFLALSDFALERMSPALSGFTGTDVAEPWDEILAPTAGARAYTVSNPSKVAVAGFSAALEEIAEAGVDLIQEAVRDLGDRVIELADEAGVAVRGPRERAERAGIVVLDPGPDGAGALAAALHNTGISATLRGGLARISVHAGTDEETLGMLRQALAEARPHAGVLSPRTAEPVPLGNTPRGSGGASAPRDAGASPAPSAPSAPSTPSDSAASRLSGAPATVTAAASAEAGTAGVTEPHRSEAVTR